MPLLTGSKYVCIMTGKPFDPKEARPPSFDGSRDGGFGVYLISQSVDEVCYSRDAAGRNCISLTKYRTVCTAESRSPDRSLIVKKQFV